MKLYIVQHGLAFSHEEHPERPLSVQGIEDIHQLARELVSRGVKPAHILHSGKRRAQMTAGIIAAGLGLAERCRQADGLKPGDDAAAFAAQANTFSGDVLIASHMPFVQNLCEELLGEGGLGDFEFSPGCCACVDVDNGAPRLDWFV